MAYSTRQEGGPAPSGLRHSLSIAGDLFQIFGIHALPGADTLPYSMRVLLENLLRHEDGDRVTRADIHALASWDPAAPPREILFHPARVMMQDYSGIPCLVELAAMREACARLGGDPGAVTPRVPADLVVDHSVMADVSGVPDAFARNAALDHERNRERYELLRWAEQAFEGLRVVPPNTGIVHQLNLELLAHVVIARDGIIYPDTVVGTDSHTPMVNGIGVLGWGVGGLEASAALLGQPLSLLTPPVIGCELTGHPADGVTATDIVLTLTQWLREHDVIGAFLEFSGPGLAALSAADRATIANMCPEFGSTAALFPIDDEVVRYLRATGRPERQLRLVRSYALELGLWHNPADVARFRYTGRLSFDLSSVVTCVAGPRRPQDRVPLSAARPAFQQAVAEAHGGPRRSARWVSPDGACHELADGVIVIAAITSCTNTANPALMMTAGLLAKKAVELGMQPRPWVKSTLAPGSPVVMEYLAGAGLQAYLAKLGFALVAYGCTTCIGNSGPLTASVSRAVRDADLACVAVLSGNRNFEGRVHPDARMNYLASPPLVVAYALAGTMDIDLTAEPLGTGAGARPVYLADIWPDPREVAQAVQSAVGPAAHGRGYARLLRGDERWRALPAGQDTLYPWSATSSYVQPPPYVTSIPADPPPLRDILGARVLVSLGDSVTTDHISPAGSIDPRSPAGEYLSGLGIPPERFNSYAARRCNHEVLVRGLFANPNLRNLLVPGTRGGRTVNHLTGEVTTVYAAAVAYRQAGVPLVVLGGNDYGMGSSRDWAAKGPALLGVRAVLAGGFERIHRSNLVAMGILPLQFPPGADAQSLGLTGTEAFDILGVGELARCLPRTLRVRAGDSCFDAVLRIDTPGEAEHFRHGGTLPFTLRALSRSVPAGTRCPAEQATRAPR